MFNLSDECLEGPDVLYPGSGLKTAVEVDTGKPRVVKAGECLQLSGRIPPLSRKGVLPWYDCRRFQSKVFPDPPYSLQGVSKRKKSQIPSYGAVTSSAQGAVREKALRRPHPSARTLRQYSGDSFP